jgi:hypothetical protein
MLVMHTRAFVRDAAPQVAQIFRRQRHGKHALEHLRHRLDIVSRMARGGEHHDLLRRALVDALRQLGEEALGLARRLGQHALVGRFRLGQIAERHFRSRDLALFEELAHAAPHIGDLDAVALPEQRRELLATFGKLGRRKPHLLGFRERRLVAARGARQPGVAADLQVIARIVGKLALELFPVGALAEDLQPVAAQALGDVGVAVLREKLARFAVGRVFELEGNPPVLDPGGEDMAFDLLGVARKLDRIAGAIGVESAEQVEVRILGARRHRSER